MGSQWVTIVPFLCLCLWLLTVVTAEKQPINLKLGLMMPKDDRFLNTKLGFATSAGAVVMALDRIYHERIVPEVNFTIVWRTPDCDEITSAGKALELFVEEKIDVLIGPPCSISAIVAGVLGANYKVPQINWAATGPELADRVRFPNLARTIPSATSLGRALKEMLAFFNWKEIALLTSDDHSRRKCFFIKEGFMSAISRADVTLSVIMELDSEKTSENDFDAFFKQAATKSRIIVVCLDYVKDRRDFMLYAQRHGYTTNEHVYIMPDYVPDENRTEPWIDYNGDPDSQNDLAKRAFEKALIVELEEKDTEKVHRFKLDIIDKVVQSPFNYKLKSNDTWGSTYSPFLHDAVLLYAKAIRKVLDSGQYVRNGTAVFESCKNQDFEGISGTVKTDTQGERLPAFAVKGFDDNRVLTAFATISTFKEDGETVHLLAPETNMWKIRGGRRPLDVPDCGFSGNACSGMGSVAPVLAASFGIILVAIVVVGGFFLTRYIRDQRQKKISVWTISYNELIDRKEYDRKLDESNSYSSSLATPKLSEGALEAEEHAGGKADLKLYKGNVVWVREYRVNSSNFSSKDYVQLQQMRLITHDNLNSFFGLCLDVPNVTLSVWKFCAKLSLKGMAYLHDSPIGTHGRLRSTNCLIDSHWMLKISNYGLWKVREHTPKAARDLLWTAPELLRLVHLSPSGSQKGDVFSFGIIMSEILSESRPYSTGELDDDETEDMSAIKIVQLVKDQQFPPFRPALKLPEPNDIAPTAVKLMRDCWQEDPANRPVFKNILVDLKAMMDGNKQQNLTDHVLAMLERYASNLEQTISDRTRLLMEEKQKADFVLCRLLPREMVEKLKSGLRIDPEKFDQATIFFTDVVGFTSICVRSSPLQVVDLLSKLHGAMDEVISSYDVYKIETIGASYMCASGLPHRNGHRHASESASAVLQIMESLKHFTVSHLTMEAVQLRVGIHTGSCVAGVIGNTVPRYCVFGDTVHIAGCMEKYSEPGKIQISEFTNKLLTKVVGGFETVKRGELKLPSGSMHYDELKEVMVTYWLVGKGENKNGK